jgi:hypothetical protein
MTANEVAALVTDATPYVTAAVGAYGGAVLAKTRDKTADATVDVGVRILQRVFGRKKAADPLPKQLADVVAHPGDAEFLAVLRVAVRKALERDAAMLADVRAIVSATRGGVVTQYVHANRDAYTSAGDMTIHQRPE